MNRKVMRKSTLISSIAMLLVAVLALSGVTFAWFSVNEKAQTDTLSLTATSANGIFIAQADDLNTTLAEIPATAWSDSLNWDTLNIGTLPAVTSAFADLKQVPVPFYKTSTTRGDGTYSDAEILTANAIDESGQGDYFVKKIFVKAGTTENRTLKMAVTITGTTKGYERVAIIDATDAENPTLVPSGKAICMNESDSALAFTNNTKGTPGLQSLEAVQYNTFDVASGDLSTSPRVFYVYFWFEGQDTDCYDTNAGASFGINLTFTTVDPSGNS